MLNKLFTNLLALLVCLLSVTTVFAQDKRITGKVTDESGLSLTGASVKIKNTNVVAVTDENGNFAISAPTTSQTIVFSYLGMQDQELVIGIN